MAISKQVVISHVEALVLIKIPKFPECVKFYKKTKQKKETESITKSQQVKQTWKLG